jgi:dihydrofolate reductase
MEFFKMMTLGNVVIMGFNTFHSLNYQPLQGRLNIVLSNDIEKCKKKMGLTHEDNILFTSDIHFYESFCKEEEGKKWCERYPFLKQNYKIFVIGGAGIYRILIPKCSCIWVSIIKDNYHCDVKFPYYSEIFNGEFVNQLYKKEKDFDVFFLKTFSSLGLIKR